MHRGHVADVNGLHIRAVAQRIQVLLPHDHIPLVFKRIEPLGIGADVHILDPHGPDETDVLTAAVQRIHDLVVQAAAAHDHPLQVEKAGQQFFDLIGAFHLPAGNVQLLDIRPEGTAADLELPEELTVGVSTGQPEHLFIRQGAAQQIDPLQLRQKSQQTVDFFIAHAPVLQVQRSGIAVHRTIPKGNRPEEENIREGGNQVSHFRFPRNFACQGHLGQMVDLIQQPLQLDHIRVRKGDFQRILR